MLNWQGYGTDEAWSLELFTEKTGIDVVHEIPFSPPGLQKVSAGAAVGDFNRDGLVGAADLATILSSWGTADAAIDLDRSGRVDVGDLGRVLAAWGDCR